jgi:hypothetical protein
MIFDVKKVRFYRVDLKGTEAGWLPASGEARRQLLEG